MLLVLPKAATVGGTTGGNSNDLRWHMDEHSYLFSVPVNTVNTDIKKICSIK